MLRKRPIKGRRVGFSAAAATSVLAAAALAVGADAAPAVKGDQQLAAASPSPSLAASPVPGQLATASARAVRWDRRAVLPTGVAPEKGLQVETIRAARAVSARFPEILNIGGVRPDSMKWHPNGQAIDVMIPNYTTAEGKALGDRIVAYTVANADRFGVNHVIFRQEIHFHNGSKRMMSDRGSPTANHYDHVHIATNGGGFPTGRETYLL